MSDCERYGSRDLTYSNWHRTHSIYRISDHQVSDGNGEHLPDIDAFRVRIVAPVQSPEREITPEQYARWISAMHRRCPCQLSVEAAA